MGDDGPRARHDTAQHRDLALVHPPPTPIGNHVTIHVGHVTHAVRQQGGPQGFGGIDELKVPEKLTEGRTVIARAKQCRQRMLMGIEYGQGLNA